MAFICLLRVLSKQEQSGMGYHLDRLLSEHPLSAAILLDM